MVESSPNSSFIGTIVDIKPANTFVSESNSFFALVAHKHPNNCNLQIETWLPLGEKQTFISGTIVEVSQFTFPNGVDGLNRTDYIITEAVDL